MAILESKCVVANLEMVANSDQVAVPVDFKLCRRRFKDEGKLCLFSNSLNPFCIAKPLPYPQPNKVLHHVCTHLSVGSRGAPLKRENLASYHGLRFFGKNMWQFFLLTLKKSCVEVFQDQPYSIPCLFSARALTELIGCSSLTKK